MAKTRTPAFSLSARKSIGSKLTFQKKGSLTMVRTKPTPSDPKTLLQIYQRWEVQDYIAYWQTLSDAQKLVYFRAGARNHRTPVAEFLKGYLSELPDIVCRYRLDTIDGSTVYDSSKNAYNGTVFGASLTDAIIDKALLFDGIDDWVRAPLDACIVDGDISVEAFIAPQQSPGVIASLISKQHHWAGALYNYELLLVRAPDLANAGIYYYYGDGSARWWGFSGNRDWTLQEWHHVCVTHDGSNIRFYYNGELWDTDASAHTLVGKDDYYFSLGRSPFNNTSLYKGKIDQPGVLNRVLALDEIYLRSQRHYPL